MCAAPIHAVFLSYASQDADAVRVLAEALRAAGVEVWFDQNELVGGDAWDAKIRQQIKACALFVPIISATTQARLEGYFRIEWKLAAQRTHAMATAKAFLLPVVIDDTRDAEAHVPEEFFSVQWTRLRPAARDFCGRAREEKDVSAFCARVVKLVGGDVTAPTTPTPRQVEAGERPAATHSRNPRRPAQLGIVGAVVVAAVVLALWQPWKPSAPATSATLAATPPTSEAARLVALAWEQMDKTEMARNELLLAESYCRKAAALDETNPAIWAAWSAMNTWFYFHQFERVPARKEAAREYAQKALALNPKSYEARYAWAHFVVRMAFKTGEERPALPILRELLRERLDEPRALYALGFGLVADPANVDEGFAALERLAEKHPWFAGRALNELGWMALFHGRFHLAESAANRAVQAQPYWNNLGLKATLALRLDGDLQLAQAMIDRLPPAVLQENWGVSLAVMVADWRGDHARAISILESVSRDWLENFFYLGPTSFLSGWMRLKAGQVAAAEKDFRRALDVIAPRLTEAPNDMVLLWIKAEALRLLGQREEAAVTYRQLCEVWPDAFPQVNFESPERALNYVQALLQRGHLIDGYPPAWWFTAASLRLDPMLENVRRAPGFKALLEAQTERERLVRAPTAPALAPPAKGQATAPAAAANEKSLVVLPLENLSPDPENAFFTEGMHTEIIATLQGNSDLKVVSRNAALAFKGSTQPIGVIARELGVANVITGSVRRERDRVRIQLELRRASDDVLLWALPKLDRPVIDAFAVQSEVAEEVSRVLQARTRSDRGGFAQFMTRHPRVYDLYLKGLNDYLNEGFRNRASVGENIALMTEAVQLDPAFMPAARLLSRLHSRAFALSEESRDWVHHATEAKKWGEIASRLAPGGAGDAGLAHYYALVVRDGERALPLAQNAIRALPNDADGYAFASYALAILGRRSEAVTHYRRATELDPAVSLYWGALIQDMSALRQAREVDETLRARPNAGSDGSRALARFRITGQLPLPSEITSATSRVHWHWRRREFAEVVTTADAVGATADDVRFALLGRKHDALQTLGRTKEAEAVAREMPGLAERLQELPDFGPSQQAYYRAHASLRTGRADDALAAARRYVETVPPAHAGSRWSRQIVLAEMLAQLKRTDECCELLAQLLRVPSGLTVPMLRVDPTWDNLRDAPAFQALLADPKNSAPL